MLLFKISLLNVSFVYLKTVNTSGALSLVCHGNSVLGNTYDGGSLCFLFFIYLTTDFV